MISWIIIPISAIAYRFRGGGIAECPDGLRKPIYCVVTGAVFALIAYFNTSIDALNALISAIIVSLGSFLPPLTSPRPLFWMWRQVYRAEEVKPNLLNGLQYLVAEKWGKGNPTMYGILYGIMRGLWELPTTIALAWWFNNPMVALWGLLGSLGMPICYFLAGRLSKMRATMWAECLYGCVRGLILTGVLLCLH